MSDQNTPPPVNDGYDFRVDFSDLFGKMLEKLESIDDHLGKVEEDAETPWKNKGFGTSGTLLQNKMLAGFLPINAKDDNADDKQPRPAFLHDIPKSINITMGKPGFNTPSQPVPAFATSNQPTFPSNVVQSQTPSGSPSLSGNNAPQAKGSTTPASQPITVQAPIVNVQAPTLPTPTVNPMTATFIPAGTSAGKQSPTPSPPATTPAPKLPTPAVTIPPSSSPTTTTIPTGPSGTPGTTSGTTPVPVTTASPPSVTVNMPTIPLQGQSPPSNTYNARSPAPVMASNPCPPGYRWDHVRGRCVPIASSTKKSRTSAPVPTQQPPVSQTQQPSFLGGLWEKLKKGLEVKDSKGEAKSKVIQARQDKARAKENVLRTRQNLSDAKSKMNAAQQRLNRALKTGKGLPRAKQDFQQQKAQYNTAKADAAAAPRAFKDAADNLRSATKDYATQSGWAGKMGEASAMARKFGFEGTANKMGMAGGGAAGGMAAGAQAIRDIKEGLSQLIHGEKFGDIVGGAAKAGTPIASAVAGPVGAAVIGPMGLIAGAVAKSVEKLREWTDALHNSNMQFAEFSSAMAGVKARSEVRQIELEQKRGDRRAEGAEDVAKLKDSISRMTAPIEDWWANKKAEFARMLRVGITDPIVRALEGTEEEPDNVDPTKWLGGMATQWIKEEVDNWDTFGRPPRFPRPR